MRGCDYFCSQVSDLNLEEQILNWLTNLIPRKEDAIHIAANFIKPNTKLTRTEFSEMYEAVTSYYEIKTVYKYKIKKDIKEFNTLKELIEYENTIWPAVTKNLILNKKTIEPIIQNLNPRFIVFRIKEFAESVSLTHGHPAFNENMYNFCFGTNLYDYELYLNYRERKVDSIKIESMINKKIKCNTMYYIRDLDRTAACTGTKPNCIYKDPEHIKVVCAGLQPMVCPANRIFTKHYRTMSEMFQDNTEIESLKSLLVFVNTN